MNNKHHFLFTLSSLVALILGFIVGYILREFSQDKFEGVMSIMESCGAIWIILLLLLTLPVVVGYISSSVLSMVKTRQFGTLGYLSLFYHGVLVFIFLSSTVIICYFFLHLGGSVIPKFSSGYEDAAKLEEMIHQYRNNQMFHPGVLKAILSQLGLVYIYLILITFVLSGLALLLPGHLQKKISTKGSKAGHKFMEVLKIFLFTLPIAVLILIIPLVYNTGIIALNISITFILFISGLLIFHHVYLYFLASLKGHLPLGVFARALLPVQLFALSSRSSLATMPAMLEAADNSIKVPSQISGTIIPFFTSTFKINSVVSGPANFLFMAHVFSLELSAGIVLSYLMSVVLLSLIGPGIPGGGPLLEMPLFLGAGIPLPGFMLIEALDPIPDMFKTILNVTEVMVVVSIVTHLLQNRQSKSSL